MPMPSIVFLKTAVLLTAVLCASASVSSENFEFRFWPAPAARFDSRFVAMHDGPCGEVATARVQSMPKYSKHEPFAPERVFEIGPQGRVLHSWNIPVDSEPYALDKDDLLFSFNMTIYRVSATGLISREASPRKLRQPEPFDCRVPTAFHGSAYARCWRHVDVRNMRSRTLAYQGVCT
jgi:hypothetical protein